MKHNYLIIVVSILIITSCYNKQILFDDPLNGKVVGKWNVEPKFIEHPEFGKVCYLKCDSTKLGTVTPWAGNETWSNYQLEFEMMVTEKKGFVGLGYNMQEKEAYGCNFHFSAFRDTIHLQSMGMWGNNKGSWKLWPVSQKSMVLEHNKWLKFRLEAGNEVANIYNNDTCVYTIYDLPFSKGGIQFWASYYGGVFYRNIKVTKLTKKIEPKLEDIWAEVRSLNVIRDWQITELKQNTYAANGLTEELHLKDEKWKNVQTDKRGVLNLSKIYPDYDKNVILAKTQINTTKPKTIKCFVTYTDRFALYCNGEEIFKGPDRNWFNPDREKYGNSRLIPDQFKIELPLKKGVNEIVVRSEVMEEFGWGFWVRTEF